MKRILSMLISVSMILTLVCVPVSASAGVTYTAPASIYYKDFSDSDMTGISVNANGSLSVRTDSVTGNNYLTLTNTNGAAKTTVAANSNVNAKYYVAEYKIKSSLMENKNYAIFTREGGGTYHAPHVTFYKGYLYKNNGYTSDANKISTEQLVKNNTWYTVTVIYDGEYVNSDGTSPYTSGDKYIYRDIYLNGKPIVKDLLTSAKYELPFISKDSGQMALNFETYGKIDFDIDYVKFYASADDFAAKLPKDTGVSPTGIEVYFNNIPTEAELLTKATVVDSSGNKVAGIASVTHNNNFDPGKEYAQSITLNFDTALEPVTTYKLKFDGLTDFAANTLSTELVFITGEKDNVAYVNPQSIYYHDFEEDEVGKTFESGNYNYTSGVGIRTVDGNSGTYGAVKDSETGYKYLSIANTTGSSRVLTHGKSSISGTDKYVIEYKIKPTLGESGAITSYDSGAYGIPTVGFYQGNIYYTSNSFIKENSIGTYKDGEWYTIMAVYYKDSSNAVVRDVYINGELKKSGISVSNTDYTTFVGGTGNIVTTINTYLGGKSELDYIRFYASADTFTVKVPAVTNIVADDGIEVQFNNIPLKSDLLDSNKVGIYDEAGNFVCGIKGVTYNNAFNPEETYAQSIVLNFAEELEKNKAYTLKINGISDISGNKVWHNEGFETGNLNGFVYGALNIAADGTTASIEVVNNTKIEKDCKLIIAGYEEYNGGIKMINAIETPVKITNGTKTYTSDILDITDCEYVKAFLWNGMLPLVGKAEKPL